MLSKGAVCVQIKEDASPMALRVLASLIDSFQNSGINAREVRSSITVSIAQYLLARRAPYSGPCMTPSTLSNCDLAMPDDLFKSEKA